MDFPHNILFIYYFVFPVLVYEMAYISEAFIRTIEGRICDRAQRYLLRQIDSPCLLQKICTSVVSRSVSLQSWQQQQTTVFARFSLIFHQVIETIMVQSRLRIALLLSARAISPQPLDVQFVFWLPALQGRLLILFYR